MAGSVANAVIDRLPRGESWFRGRSKCDKCRHLLAILDLVPIASYASLRGKCRYCHSPIPVRNLVVEIVLGISLLLIGRIGHIGLIDQIVLMGIAWVTTVIFVMDQETMLVSDAMVAIWAALVIFSHLGDLGNLSYLWGMGVGVVIIGGIWLMSRGKAMGSGDIGIIGVIGLWVSWPNILVALWMAFVIGAVVSCWLLVVSKKSVKSMIAFGPYLIVGGWVAYFWGDMITSWIFRY